MFSRIIIEQKLADLELALARQDELIKSQREVIRGLKELIVLEYQNGWQATASPSTNVAVVSSNNTNTTTTAPRTTSTKRSAEALANTSYTPAQTIHNSNNTKSLVSAQEVIQVTDSAKKRQKSEAVAIESSVVKQSLPHSGSLTSLATPGPTTSVSLSSNSSTALFIKLCIHY